MITSSIKARGVNISPATVLCEQLGMTVSEHISAVFARGDCFDIAVGADGLPFYTPVIGALIADEFLCAAFERAFTGKRSVLVRWNSDENSTTMLVGSGGTSSPFPLSEVEQERMNAIISQSLSWGGTLDAMGQHVCDLKSPQPGPNYYTNMLIGNRMGYKRPLQSTPKAVVDRLGHGSFRSHADTQVLATRWDYRPEENGNPANRQFYLVENGNVIFYSGAPEDNNVLSARCIHSANHTVIEYETACGLVIRRTIFILPQYDGLPVATEAQLVEIHNKGVSARNLRIVYTGMFGTPATHALMQDIIYTTVICQSEVLYDESGNIAAVSYDYNPPWEKGNVRYHSTILHQNGKVIYPDSFCFKFDELVGSGSLKKPEFAGALPNRHTRKGPGFFAVGVPFTVNRGDSVSVDNFTGLISEVVEDHYDVVQTTRTQIAALLERYSDENAIRNSLDEVKTFCNQYASYLSVESNDPLFDSYCNHNLPFQVFYQTFVSRSFDQTQKGYREIGFREIQDIFASMYYFVGMGRPDFVRQLISEWASNVYAMGYANHNFYWKGKEPGVYSDDSLWLFQAVGRYIDLTGDLAFLDQEIAIADGGNRPLWETLGAIITYSAKISVGKHGFPLIDAADWNDCLHVDPDCLNGIEKEDAYSKQLEQGGQYGEPFKSNLSESIMNGFLLKVAIDILVKLAAAKGKTNEAKYYSSLGDDLAQRLQKDTWKGDYFARVLFNRGNGLDYLGAKGDTLAIEEGAEGTYFLNSFTWSVLGNIATDEQIETMLDTIDKHLRTPYGYRLCTGVDYPRIAPRIAVALYFPGDRENGGVFKHANTMAATAMLKAANTVKDPCLAKRLTETAYWIIDVILPYKTLSAPFVTCGNPRFCTQYNNYESGENIGPTLSGTSTWLLLSLMEAFGIEYRADGLKLHPLLRPEEMNLSYTLKTGDTSYVINIRKDAGFARCADGCTVKLDGTVLSNSLIPLLNDGKEHLVELFFTQK